MANKHTGFSLIELLVVLAIVAILASIAYPSYSRSVQKSHRIEAMGEMLELATQVEEIRVQTLSYLSANQLSVSLSRYQLRVNATSPTKYRVLATPQGAQLNDACGEFSVSETGDWQFPNGLTRADCS